MINIQTRTLVESFEYISKENISCLALSFDGRFLAIGGSTQLQVFEIETKQEVCHLEEIAREII